MKAVLASILALALAGALAVAGCSSDDGGPGGKGPGGSGGGAAGSGGSGGAGGSGGSGGGTGGGGSGGVGGTGGTMEVPLAGLIVVSSDSSLTFLEDLQGTSWTWMSFASGLSTNELVLKSPRDIDFRPGDMPWPADGKLLIADTQNDRIVEVTGNPFGAPIVKTYGGPQSKPLKGPRGVAYDSKGFLYVADTGNDRILRLNDITGRTVKYLGARGNSDYQFISPGGIALGADDWIYVADTGNNRVVKMNDMDGVAWLPIEAEVNGVKLSLPSHLFVDRTRRIYVADTSNHRIVRYNDLAGESSDALGTEGGGDLQFKDPTDVFVDDTGILVVDSGVGGTMENPTNSRLVHVTDMLGTDWTAYGVPGVGRNPGKFTGPQAVAHTH